MLRFAAPKMHRSQQDILRLCLAIGLEHLKQIDYDEAKCIVETVEKKRSQPSDAEIEIEESTIEADGQKLRLLSSKPSLSSTSEKTEINSVACPPEKTTARPATSTGTGRKKPSLPKKGADIVQLPKSHWGAGSAKVAEDTTPHESSSEDNLQQRDQA